MLYISNFINNNTIAIPRNFGDGTAVSVLIIVYWYFTSLLPYLKPSLWVFT